MQDIHLFLGFPVDPLFQDQLEKVNPALRKQFIQKEGDYLNETEKDGIRYLGKKVGKIAPLQQIDLLEENIRSLLKKLVPDFPYEECPIYLFPVPHNESA